MRPAFVVCCSFICVYAFLLVLYLFYSVFAVCLLILYLLCVCLLACEELAMGMAQQTQATAVEAFILCLLFVCLFVCLFDCLFVCEFFVCLLVLCLSVCLFVCLLVLCLSVCLFVFACKERRRACVAAARPKSASFRHAPFQSALHGHNPRPM